jgi:CRP-like cAMP-binding protein
LRARQPSKVLVLEQEAFRSLVRARPWLGIGLFERLGRKLSQSLDQAIEQRVGNELPRLPGERF